MVAARRKSHCRPRVLSRSTPNETRVSGGPSRFPARGTGDDSLYGGSGDDALMGAASTDFLEGGAGADVLDGGDGRNAVMYELSDAGVMIQRISATATT